MGGFYIEAGLAAYACLVVYHLLLVGTAIIDARSEERRICSFSSCSPYTYIY